MDTRKLNLPDGIAAVDTTEPFLEPLQNELLLAHG